MFLILFFQYIYNKLPVRNGFSLLKNILKIVIFFDPKRFFHTFTRIMDSFFRSRHLLVAPRTLSQSNLIVFISIKDLFFIDVQALTLVFSLKKRPLRRFSGLRC